MRKVVGIDRKIKRAWVDATLDRLAQMTDEAELRTFLDKHLKDELPGKESRAKTTGIILRIWSGIPPERASLRDRAVAMLPRISGQERIWLHWGMTALAYPFFRDTAEVVGRLLALQDDFTTAQVQGRMLTTWGDRATSKEAAQKLITTLVDWEVLRSTNTKGHFLLARKMTASIPDLQLWLLEALLGASAADEIDAQQLLRLPESFPFTLSIGIADLRKYEGFNIHRQGLDMDMVALRKVKLEPPPKPTKKPKMEKPAKSNVPSLFDRNTEDVVSSKGRLDASPIVTVPTQGVADHQGGVMKLYRYRPLSAFLFKELLYSEIYLASPSELNDPLDLNGQLNFYTDTEDELKMLVHFLFSRAFVSHGDITLFRKLEAVMSFEKLGSYIKANLAHNTGVVVSKSRLFDILSRFYAEIVSIETQLEELKVEPLLSALDELFTQFLNNSCVACFSETNTNFLMWSHYASGHTGICLEFDVPADPANSNTYQLPLLSNGLIQGKFLKWAENVRMVGYRESLSTINFYTYLPLFNNAHDVDVLNLSKARWHQYAEGIRDIFLQKLTPWSEEKEWRIVTTSFKNEMPEDRIRKYHSSALTGVYFGARSSDQTKERVRNILEKANKANKALAFYQCSVDGTRGVIVEQI